MLQEHSNNSILRRISTIANREASLSSAVKALEVAQGQAPLAGRFQALVNVAKSRGIHIGQLTEVAANHIERLAEHLSTDEAHAVVADCLNIVIYFARSHTTVKGHGSKSKNGTAKGKLSKEIVSVNQAFLALLRKIEAEIGDLTVGDDGVEVLGAFAAGTADVRGHFVRIVGDFYGHSERMLKLYRDPAAASLFAIKKRGLRVQSAAFALVEAYFSTFGSSGLFAPRVMKTWRRSLGAKARRTLELKVGKSKGRHRPASR